MVVIYESFDCTLMNWLWLVWGPCFLPTICMVNLRAPYTWCSKNVHFCCPMSITGNKCKWDFVHIWHTQGIPRGECKGSRKSFSLIVYKLSTTATLGAEESGCDGEMAIMGRKGCNMTIVFFERVQNVYCAQWLLLRGYFGSWGHALVAVTIVASQADVLRGLSQVLAPWTSANLSRKKRRLITADFQIWEVHFGPGEILHLTHPQKRSERSHERWRPYSFRKNYSVNSQAFILVPTLRISLKKITRRLNLLSRSQLYYKTIMCEKTLPFVQSYNSNPTIASPKKQLYEEMTSNPAFTEKNIQKANAYLLYSLQEQKSLVTYHALQSLYVYVWLVNTLTPTELIGSPIICMWSPIFANNGKGIYLSVQQTFVGQERVTNP